MRWLSKLSPRKLLGYEMYVPDLEAHRRHDKAVMARVLDGHTCVWIGTARGEFCSFCEQPREHKPTAPVRPIDTPDPFFMPGRAA